MPRPHGDLTGAARYRAAWSTGALVLQVEERTRRPRVCGDGYHPGDAILITKWRDARASDLPKIEYYRCAAQRS